MSKKIRLKYNKKEVSCLAVVRKKKIRMIGVKVIATSCGLPGSAPLGGKDNQKRWETIRHNRALKTVKSGARIRTSESSLGSSDNRLVPILSKKVEKKDMLSLAKLVDHGWTWVVRRTCGRIPLADSRWRSTTPNDRPGAMLAPGRPYLPGKVRMACEPRQYYFMSLIVKYGFIINKYSS